MSWGRREGEGREERGREKERDRESMRRERKGCDGGLGWGAMKVEGFIISYFYGLQFKMHFKNILLI